MKNKSRTRVINLLKGKQFDVSAEHFEVKITDPDMASTDFSRTGEAWKIKYNAGKDSVIDVQRKKGYLFIPKLSIFEAIKNPRGQII